MDPIQQIIQALQTAQRTGYTEKISAGGTAVPTGRLVYGAGMFSYCGGNELISTLITDDHLSTWLGMEGSVIDPEISKTIGWIGPDGTADGSPDWDRDGECEDCPAVEFGKCELITCFGEICHSGADLKITQVGLRGCDVEPIYRIRGPMAGTRIDNDREWQLALAGQVAKQNFERIMIIGNRTVTNWHFDGLQQVINSPIYDVRTGLRCQDVEPEIYAWGSATITSNICDVISALVRKLRWKGSFLGGIAQPDLVLVMTRLMRDALIDFASCGCGPCTGDSGFHIDALEARRERARLATGGTFGEGMFEVDGIPVSIVTNDWIPQTSTAPNFCSDIYILTRRVGGLRVFYGQYQDFARTLSGVPVENLVFGSRVTDGGRFLSYSKSRNECFNETVEDRPFTPVIACRIRLYAGKPEYPEVLGLTSQTEQKSEGADNPQGRRSCPLRDYTSDTLWGDDIVRSAWRHAEVGRNDQSAFLGGNSMLVQASFKADSAVVTGARDERMCALRHPATNSTAG